jgi:excinuclease ABC subunit A
VAEPETSGRTTRGASVGTAATPERAEARSGRGNIEVRGASEHNLKGIDVSIARGAITVVTGVSGSGKSSLAFDTILAESQRRFFYTLSHYTRQFLDLKSRPAARSIGGLSPAIALAQNETPPSRRATVGTLVDLSELTGVMLARFGEQRCPEHDLPTGALEPGAIVDGILAQYGADTASGGKGAKGLTVLVPVATAKKGTFRAQLTAFAERGYVKAFIDGELEPLSPVPTLGREDKHTIKVVLDQLRLRADLRPRLVRAIETAILEGKGYGEYLVHDVGTGVAPDPGAAVTFSAKGGCPTCGFAWPRLEARHFAANSLGRCEICNGLGTVAVGKTGTAAALDEDDEAAEAGEVVPGGSPGERDCTACRGTGLKAELAAIKLAGRGPHDLHRLPLEDYARFLDTLAASPLGANPALLRVVNEARAIARRVTEVGLGYLSMARRVRTLSGGEAQRLKLSGILAESLRGVLYVLDEPSQGLHPTEVGRLVGILGRLRDQGNTVVVVDHDEGLMLGADWIVDLGPGGGAQGGRLMATFPPAQAARFARESLTARWLSGGVARSETALRPARALSAAEGGATAPDAIVLKGARRHNLQLPEVRFPRSAFTVVTGVSGAGKTSLVLGTLYPNAAREVAATTERGRPRSKREGKAQPTDCDAVSGLEGLVSVALVDRRPIAKSSVSMPASYLDIMGELRDLYASLPDAQIMGLTPRSFSLSVEGGRCPECKGRGELSLSMKFLADARVPCAVCGGRRFMPNVLAVKYGPSGGLSLDEVLELTLEEVAQRFSTHRRIAQRLAPALDLGLGYLKLGQPTASLSGGEAQRLKLVPYLTTRVRDAGAGALLILDEPTTGLHFADVERLMQVVHRLTAGGATIVMIEHHQDVIAAADWRIDLGPGPAAKGGRLVRQGAPADFPRS